MVALVIVALQPVPGYMDADYYYAGGKQLASGHGFTDPFLWNYLDHPQGLPHPSNSYWNPLASIVAAGGMVLTGKINFLSARIGFILMAALAPLVVAALAYRISRKRHLALLAGLLTIFSGYYLPFIVTTDNYSLYMLVGALYFLILDQIDFPKINFARFAGGGIQPGTRGWVTLAAAYPVGCDGAGLPAGYRRFLAGPPNAFCFRMVFWLFWAICW